MNTTNAGHHGRPAVIYVPKDRNYSRHLDACLDHCRNEGYRVADVKHESDKAALEVIYRRKAVILVVAREDHLDPNREPRIEIAGSGRLREARSDGGYADGFADGWEAASARDTQLTHDLRST